MPRTLKGNPMQFTGKTALVTGAAGGIGSAVARAFTAAGQLRFAGGLVRGDVDGDGQADFAIQIGAQPGLSDADLLRELARRRRAKDRCH